jgi:hypothetical protein
MNKAKIKANDTTTLRDNDDYESFAFFLRNDTRASHTTNFTHNMFEVGSTKLAQGVRPSLKKFIKLKKSN